jgi:fibronectin type 3 domain-containing protein
MTKRFLAILCLYCACLPLAGAGAPGNLSATQGTVDNEVDLAWTGDPSAAGYDIYRRDATLPGQTPVKINGSPVVGTAYADLLANPELTYIYTVAANHASGAALLSNQAEGWAGHADLTPAATMGTLYREVDVSWPAARNAASYDVYREDHLTLADGSQLVLPAAKVNAAPLVLPLFADTNVVAGNDYCYSVAGNYLWGQGAASPKSCGWSLYSDPTVVVGLSATTNLYREVDLSWTATPGATGYDVYRADAFGAGPAAKVNAAPAVIPFFADTDAVPGKVYNYSVAAIFAGGSGAASSPVAGWSSSTDPSAVRDLSATYSLYGEIDLSWSASPGAASYDVYRDGSFGAGPPVKINAAPVLLPLFADTGVDSGWSYAYTVVANLAARSTEPSNRAYGSAKPLYPVDGLSASRGTLAGAVRLDWMANPDATGYDVYRAEAWGAPGAQINASPVVSAYYVDAAPAGHGYYTVVTRRGRVSSDPSYAVEGWPMPAPVSDLSASQGTGYGAVSLAWTAVPDAEGYDVYRADSPTGIPAKLNGWRLTSAAFTDVVSDGAHRFYTVAIVMRDGASTQPSNQAEGWASATNRVSDLSASQGTAYGAVSLAWTAVPDAEGYDVYRADSPSGVPAKLNGWRLTSAAFTHVVTDGEHSIYTVAAVMQDGASTEPSNQAEGWGKLPAAVGGLSASRGTVQGAVSLAWDANPDATGYDVYRADSETGVPVKLNGPPWWFNAYDDGTAGGHGFYTVVARVDGASSPASDAAEGWPAPGAAVSGLSASQGGLFGAVLLAWTANPDAAGYDVYRADSPAGVPYKLNGSPVASASFLDYPVEDGAHRYYTVAASVAGFGSPRSNQAEGWGAVPGAVEGLAASQGTATGAVRLDWRATPNATGYEIYRASSASDPGQAVATVAAPGFSDALADALPRYYAVRALAGVVRGPFSGPASGYANLPPTSASAELPGTATPAGSKTIPAVSDPNLDAGEAESFTFKVAAQPAHGTVSVFDGGFAYAPPPGGYSGTGDTFSFTVTDKGGASMTGSGSISAGACPAPSLSSLDVPAGLLPFEAGTVAARYTAYDCNGPLSGSLSVAPAGGPPYTSPATNFSSGTARAGFDGLTSGTYNVAFTVTGSAGSGSKSGKLTVATVPAPVLSSKSWTPYQGDDGVALSVADANGSPCPLTGSDATARADRSKCLAKFDALPEGLVAGFDAKGLPAAAGYLATAGSQTAAVSVWRYGSDMALHRVASATATFKVRPAGAQAFGLSGETAVLAGDALALALKQTAGALPCALHTDAAQAAAAAKSGRACLVELSLPAFMTQAATAGRDAVRLGGTPAAAGAYPVAYTVVRVHADGTSQPLAKGSATVVVQPVTLPVVSLSGGTLVGPGRYYVQAGSPMARVAVRIPGAPGKARLTLTVDDGKAARVFPNLSSGTSFALALGKMALFEERTVAFKLAYTAKPAVFAEKTVSAVGGTAYGVRALLKAPARVSDADKLAVTLNVGVYGAHGLAYDAASQGAWTAYLAVQDDNGKEKTIAGPVPVADGQATFAVDPSGYVFMKLTAHASLVSADPAIRQTLESNSPFVQVVKGTPIAGNLSANPGQAPVNTVFAVNLSLSKANAAALGGIAWEESADGGATWTTAKANGGARYSASLRTPQTLLVRARLVNRNNGVASWTEPASLWAYPVLSLAVAGPSHAAPGTPAILTAAATDGGKPVDAVVEWTTDQPSGKQSFAGTSIRVSEARAGSVKVLARARLASTQAGDKNAWVFVRHTVVVSPPLAPRLAVSGPSLVETGKAYHYKGTAFPSWGSLASAQSVHLEWELPDGTVHPGSSLDWTPEAADTASGKPLLFRAWVEGFQDSTTASAKLPVAGWTYVWPAWTLKAAADGNRAPATVFLQLLHDRPEMSRHLEGVRYQWDFPSGVDAVKNGSDPSRAQAVVQRSGDIPLAVTVTDARGNASTLGQTFSIQEPVPYAMSLTSIPSNRWNRAPVDMAIRATVTGGHPKDRVAELLWSLDGVEIPALADRAAGVVRIGQPGEHAVAVAGQSMMGKTFAATASFNLKEDIPPTCEIGLRASANGPVATASCSDADGRVAGYAWTLDGAPVGSGAARIVLSPGKTPKSAPLCLSATDDAGKVSAPVCKNVNY